MHTVIRFLQISTEHINGTVDAHINKMIVQKSDLLNRLPLPPFSVQSPKAISFFLFPFKTILGYSFLIAVFVLSIILRFIGIYNAEEFMQRGYAESEYSTEVMYRIYNLLNHV